LYSISFWNSQHCKELFIDINNKIGSCNLYVVNVRFHLNVFNTQVLVFPYISKRDGHGQKERGKRTLFKFSFK